MKANDGSGNNEGRDNWETPQKLWDQLNKQYSFRIDCCGDCYKSFKKWLKYRKNN